MILPWLCPTPQLHSTSAVGACPNQPPQVVLVGDQSVGKTALVMWDLPGHLEGSMVEAGWYVKLRLSIS